MLVEGLIGLFIIIVLIGVIVNLATILGLFVVVLLSVAVSLFFPYMVGKLVDPSLGLILFVTEIIIFVVVFGYHRYSQNKMKEWD